MFKNRVFHVTTSKVKKTKQKDDATPETEEEYINLDPEHLAEVAKDFVTHTAVVVGCTFAAVKILSAVSEIAVKRTPSKDKE